MPPEAEMSDADLLAQLAKPTWPQADWEMPLRKALTLPEGGEIASLQLREPTEAEWETAKAKEPALQRRSLIAAVSGVPVQVVARMGIGDAVRAEEYLSSFFAAGLAIGVS
jgi:hypothetical protein